MDYRTLGRCGLKVSPLCLGTMNFGGPTDAALALRIIDRARDLGINFIDTADAYAGGRSEEIIGPAVRADRRHWVLATKLANPRGKGPNERGLSRRGVFEAAEASLMRLGIETIDLYYLHKEDPDTPLEETVRAMGDLIRQGKVRYFGVSNYKSWRIAEICAIADRLGIDRPVVSQPYYNAMNRQAEIEQLPACAHFGLGIVPYSPLARGVLTAKYDPDAPPPEGTRAGRRDRRMLESEWRHESLVIARRLQDHAQGRGAAPGHFALAWVLANALVTSVIAGPRTIEQLEDYQGALAYRWDAADEALVDSLVSPGHPSTAGFNDPAYPIEGRVVRPHHQTRGG